MKAFKDDQDKGGGGGGGGGGLTGTNKNEVRLSDLAFN